MKSLLFLLLLPIFSFAQNEIPDLPIDSTTHLITYEGVITVQGSKDQLYSKGREWFAKTYNSAQNVIQMDDKDEIVGKALMQVYYKRLGMQREGGYINYTISIYFKDGKYKYLITNFYHTGQYDSFGNYFNAIGTCEAMVNEKRRSYKKLYNYFLTELDNNTKSLIERLKESMNAQTVPDKKDNW